mmetsp:Transcript_41002/g.60343  ORF Transcript_41002/g.60343 Transcript_41002/m.60343 type:complete len:291 (-) Transcript_41002:60-932(-)
MAFLFGDSNRKKELYSKILGKIEPEANPAVCALYDTAAGKCAEGLSMHSIAQILARGMMGTPTADPDWTFHWIMGPTFDDLSDPTGERMKIVTLFMKYIMLPCWFYSSEGAVIGSRNAEGEISAVNVVRVYRSGYSKQLGERLWDFRTTLREMLAGTIPSLYTNSNQKSLKTHVEARTDVLVETFARFHAQHAPGPHYYVALMAVLPDKQGQGHCSKLMRAINRAADTDQLPCYLECTGEKNKKVYMRFGYKMVHQFTLSVENPESGSGQSSDIYCMLREPGEHSVSVDK